ncbi:Hsp70 family protein [Streptomyces sp. NPDC008137]|uniref:Hsp70 family protein n=1 Tax=Streptomyces sp. NPDC008137 TaxID=3364813 RepID=UPI0036ED05CC
MTQQETGGADHPRHSVGLDLGDGESALAWLDWREDTAVRLYQRPSGEVDVVTAMCRTVDGGALFGEIALHDPEARQVRVNFKGRPRAGRAGLLPPSDAADFARLFLIEFGERHPEVLEDCVVHVGHPAGWDQDAVDVYRAQLESALPTLNVKLVPESQSAFLHVYDAIGARTVDGPALVVDVGSSTTDFTYVTEGAAVNLSYGDGLGGRKIDQEIMEAALARVTDPVVVERLSRPSPDCLLRWLSRRHKEAAFTGTASEPPEAERRSELQWIIDHAWPMISAIEVLPLVERAGGWRDRFVSELEKVKEHLVGGKDELPKQIVPTGGGSRMPFVVEGCRRAFPDAQIVCPQDPSLSVARGLASYGRWRARVADFRKGVKELTESAKLTALIEKEANPLAQRFFRITMENARDVLLRPVLEAAESGSDLKDLLGLEQQRERLLTWLESPEGQASREELFGSLERDIERVLGPDAEQLCRRCSLPSKALTVHITVPASVLMQPSGRLIRTYQKYAESKVPDVQRWLRSKAYRKTVDAYLSSVQALYRRLPDGLVALEGRAYVIRGDDLTALSRAIRDEVRRQMLRNSRDIELLLA